MNSQQRGSVRVEPGSKRVRAYLQGQLVVDTLRPLLVWEFPYYPTYYVPVEDVHAELIPTGEVQHSPSRGDGLTHDTTIGDATAKGAALRFPDSPIEELRTAVRLDFRPWTNGSKRTSPSMSTHATRTRVSTYWPAPDGSWWRSTARW